MKTKEVIHFLKQNKQLVSQKKAMVGIDGFVDKIIRPVKSKDSDNSYTFFPTITEFGTFIISKAGMSCGIQIRESFTKLGGNSPIMASALCATGLNVDCIGALGYPVTDPIFEGIGQTCTIYSVGNPGYTTAIEFEDGKVMLNQRDALHDVNWYTFKTILGIEQMEKFFNESDMIGLVNWNAMIHYNGIMRGILDDILTKKPVDKSKLIFFDTADISERTDKDVIDFIELAKEFNRYSKVILGVNANEAILFYKILFPNKAIPTIKTIGDELYSIVKCDILVIHTLLNAFAWENDECFDAPSLYVKKPKLSTGGGDNFNAGLCFGLMMGVDLEGALYTANATSGSYVRNAESPSYEKLIETLENWDELIEQPEH